MVATQTVSEAALVLADLAEVIRGRRMAAVIMGTTSASTHDMSRFAGQAQAFGMVEDIIADRLQELTVRGQL